MILAACASHKTKLFRHVIFAASLNFMFSVVLVQHLNYDFS